MASFYGNESGSKTASGERFNQNALTAAHRTLPFGTKLRVSRGDRSVIVTINDRGPFVRGRVLDLSTGAARAIGLTSAGVGRVVAEVVS
jgi:rare lipoprotein A